MAEAATKDVVNAWIALWDGDLAQIPRVVSPDFVAHTAPLTGGAPVDIQGHDGLHAWVAGAHQALPGLHYTLQRDPLRDGDMVVTHWLAEATYPGGIPGASAEPGTPVRFYGLDMLRLNDDDRIVEYWVHPDSLWFMQQLGLRELPPLEAAG